MGEGRGRQLTTLQDRGNNKENGRYLGKNEKQTKQWVKTNGRTQGGASVSFIIIDNHCHDDGGHDGDDNRDGDGDDDCDEQVLARRLPPPAEENGENAKVSVEDVRFPGPEEDQGRKIVELVLFVDAVVGNLDQVDVGVVKLKIFNLFLERI